MQFANRTIKIQIFILVTSVDSDQTVQMLWAESTLVACYKVKSFSILKDLLLQRKKDGTLRVFMSVYEYIGPFVRQRDISPIPPPPLIHQKVPVCASKNSDMAHTL